MRLAPAANENEAQAVVVTQPDVLLRGNFNNEGLGEPRLAALVPELYLLPKSVGSSDSMERDRRE